MFRLISKAALKIDSMISPEAILLAIPTLLTATVLALIVNYYFGVNPAVALFVAVLGTDWVLNTVGEEMRK